MYASLCVSVWGSPFGGDWEELCVSGGEGMAEGHIFLWGELGLSQCGGLAASLCLAGGGRFCGGCVWCVSPQEGRRGHGALRRGDICVCVWMYVKVCGGRQWSSCESLSRGPMCPAG